jgi:hypothetical protein
LLFGEEVVRERFAKGRRDCGAGNELGVVEEVVDLDFASLRRRRYRGD